jgi:hypothetical protein
MQCNEHLISEVCYTNGLGVKSTLLAHYTYGKAANVIQSALVRTVYTDASGTPVDTVAGGGSVTVGACALQTSSMQTESFAATAGQTVFVLSFAPVGDVSFARNGVTLADGAATTVTNSLNITYVPTVNNSQTLIAGDRIDISYLYSA